MRLGSFPTLLLAAVLSGPAIWHAAVVRDMDPQTALLRYLIAVPIAGVMLALLRSITRGYQDKAAGESKPPLHVEAVTGEPLAPQRRTTDGQPDQ